MVEAVGGRVELELELELVLELRILYFISCTVLSEYIVFYD